MPCLWLHPDFPRPLPPALTLNYTYTKIRCKLVCLQPDSETFNDKHKRCRTAPGGPFGPDDCGQTCRGEQTAVSQAMPPLWTLNRNSEQAATIQDTYRACKAYDAKEWNLGRFESAWAARRCGTSDLSSKAKHDAQLKHHQKQCW